MLSYNTSVAVNGQRPSSSGAMSSGRQSIPSSPKASRLPTTLSNGVMANGATSAAEAPAKDQHIWLVTGPAGCGKSTVAKHIADSLQLPFIEGDEYHPKANIDKMSAGIPLTDADRWDWLTALREASIHELDKGSDGVVLTCSALKRKYRDVIRVAPYFTPNVYLHFIYLDAPEEVLLQRVSARKNHYMGANMVHSQFEVLERPTPDEIDVITIDVTQSQEVVKADALDRANKTMHSTQS
ncbi:P-loop containing nucleoside triphosphate hydrolase protein [Chaetomium tenue]|uniref:P-loop containing nucleoside triphosphate hydrolase protein n=1 Tax=Chaetomium tenue TaxID=1854479 RepID=A0ACB7PG71_9PEZI|nr:P-loop containing nucleoside triphosphate hydrolase protein [Chaetomium globosum]